MVDPQLDGLEEFFDFSQLEHDSTIQQQHSQNALSPELESAMDWQPTGLNTSDDYVPVALDVTCHDSTATHQSSNMYYLTPTSLLEEPMEVTYQQTDVRDNLALDSIAPISLPNYQVPQEVIVAPTKSGPSMSTRGEKVAPPTPLRRNSTANHKPASATRKGASNRIPLEARQMLEEEFATNPYPCSWEIDIIAHQANLDVKRVRNWFNNTRARKKGSDALEAIVPKPNNNSTCSLASQLSRDSLEALDKHANETVQPPQPPLAVYLAQSYQEEAVTFSAIQAAIDNGSFSDEGDYQMDASSSLMNRSGSVITSINSSEGTAPTTYSSGSNLSSFNRDRRRGRRRMAWKTSPYTRTKLNGLNSAGQPQEDLPFCCTFCPRAFKTKYEWIRHEDSVHALRTTWICCDNKNAPLLSCPFCGQMEPDEQHMASHKYQQCRNKPESQRTFYRRDHFIQHLHHVHFANVKHPSARLGCQARLMDSEGNNFGCKDLAVKWRRFGAPIKIDDPMLHCGFCGKRSKTWSERCEHVAEHMYAGELDRSAWWAERLENHLENLCPPDAVGPFRCRYCRTVFANTEEMNKHSHCRVWSCRFLRSFDDVAAEDAGPPLCSQFPSPKAHHCHLCGAGYRSFHVEHAQHHHHYRQCDQRLYTSEDEFLQHMHDSHGASLPSALKGNSILEQNFSRNKGASFEPLQLESPSPSQEPTHIAVDNTRRSHPAVSVAEPPRNTPKQQSRPNSALKKPPPSTTTTSFSTSSSQSKSTKTRRQRSSTSTTPAATTTNNAKSAPSGPRFFRLSPLVPFLASKIYYLRSAAPPNFLVSNSQATVEEMEKSHVASLVMSSGLVGLAAVRFRLGMKRGVGMGSEGGKGREVVEFGLEEDDNE